MRHVCMPRYGKTVGSGSDLVVGLHGVTATVFVVRSGNTHLEG